MRFAIVAAGVLAASAVVFSASAARADGGNLDDKKIVVGGDLQFEIPVGDMSNGTGPQLGPLVRVGYRVMPQLEITGRLGYLFGFDKTTSAAGESVSSHLNNFPIWVGARYYFMNAPAGLYGAAELALNVMTASASTSGNVAGNSLNASVSQGETREGFNIGAGYVISPDLPIDIRVQYSYFNLLGTSSGESALMGIGISAGYSFFF